jgi:glycosyltransferase involved in cell wall biosynthesis
VTSPLKPPSERERLLDRILRVEKVAQSRDREIERLQSLLYGATVGQHLYRAWQVLTGNPHYRRKKLIPKIDPATVSGYHDLLIEGLRVKFHKAALADVRGTGRVARELLLQFQALADASAETPALDAQPVHFFAAPHWGPALLPARSCVVIHDTIPSLTPGYPDGQRAIFENRCREVIGQAEKLITISRTSAHDISRLFGVPLDRLHIIPNGVSRLPVSASTGVILPAAPFVVYVGGGDSHKNIPVVLEALTRPEISDIHLVMIGDNEFFRPVAEVCGIADRVHCLGRQDDAVVGHVITRSAALVFPSLHEGFGLPPLEAAVLGVPSICSRRPAMTELLADAALFAEPDSPEEWAQRIHAITTSPALRNSVAARAQAAAETLQWPSTARSYLAAFKSMH